MSEVCEICERKKDDGKGSDDTCEREYLGLGTDDSRCYRLGYERALARADRYEAEFAACKALLIAAEGRAEEAERRAREWKETADKYTLKWDAELVRRAAAEQRASEVRAALEEMFEQFENFEYTTGTEAIQRARAALAALPVEPARRQVTENANALGAPAAGCSEEKS
jgi:hypothetical protein